MRRQARCAGIILSLLLPASGAVAEGAQPRGSSDHAGRRFSLVVTGDAIGPYQPVTQTGDPRIRAIAAILKNADAAFGNQEGSIFDIASFTGSLGAENGGGTPLGSAAVGSDLKNFGLTLMSKANNHAVDWGIEGLAATERSLDAAGIAHAGSGADEETARAPTYFDTAHGRVALVATASTYPDMARAGPAVTRDGVRLRGRPGISALRVSETFLVTEPEMAALRAIVCRHTDPPGTSAGQGAPSTSPLRLFDLHTGEQSYETSTLPGLRYQMDQDDLAAVLGAVRLARQHADHVLFSIHAHETASGAVEDTAPADFLPPLFHQAIDAGADVVVRHGPHALKGIEIFKGRPIFYGMGSFFMGIGGPDRRFRGETLPASWDESVIAVVDMRDDKVVDVRLYPIRSIREAGPLVGAPMLSPPDDAHRILKMLQADSAVYGTRIAIEGEVGVIRVN
jgi:poly-gamma-glutamate capsule biosynthesis protein CapA/YwtB (metallophosphatase superfamily)